MNKRNKNRGFFLALISGMALLLLGGFSGLASATVFVIGFQCDRSGATQTVGAFLCDGSHDYIKLFNKKNSMGPGNSIRLFEIDHGYRVDRGLEAYERHKAAGALTIAIYGTPHTYSLTKKLVADKILGTSPGFGSAAAANGKKFPYLFPAAATYWSQAGTAVKFVMDKWEGSPSKLKIAYIFFDNPAGREPIPILEDLQKRIGFELRQFAVPSPGIEMRPQVLDIARRYKADWVIAHLFGRAPGVSLKEFRRVRFPMNRIVSFIWGGGESDMNLAGWDNAEGYQVLQVAGVGQDHKIIQEIIKMYADEGKPPPKAMKISVYYNRGVGWAAMHARAIQLAFQKYGENVTSEQVKEGMESIKNFGLDGFMPPLTFSAEDHEGGGWTQVWQVKGGKFVKVSDWIQGYRDVVMKRVNAG